MKVSVVIPAYNEEQYIQKCLEGLLAQEEEPDEIIVVDNNSTDRTAEIVRGYPQVKLVTEVVQGMTPARNKGFNQAKYTVIARTDADTIVRPDWIKKIKQAFRNRQLVALSGPTYFYDVPTGVDVAKFPIKIFFPMFKHIIGHDCLYGPNMAIRKSAWEKIKHDVCMEDKLVHEDIDLALHIARVGEVLFDFNLVVDSSFRRWKKVPPYFEYPYRYLRTIQHHKMALDKKTMIKRVKRLSPKRLLKRNKYTKKLLPLFAKTIN